MYTKSRNFQMKGIKTLIALNLNCFLTSFSLKGVAFDRKDTQPKICHEKIIKSIHFENVFVDVMTFLENANVYLPVFPFRVIPVCV